MLVMDHNNRNRKEIRNPLKMSIQGIQRETTITTTSLNRQQEEELLDIYNLVSEMINRAQARPFLDYKRSQLETITAYLYKKISQSSLS